MSNGYMIETRDGVAGVAVREGSGFRFFASEPPFYALDRRTFPQLRALRSAVDAVAKETQAGGGPAR